MTASAKVRMVAAARQRYDGRQLRINDEFDAKDESDARDLEALRFAYRKPNVIEEVTKDVEAAESPKETETKEETQEIIKQHYETRDMQAQTGKYNKHNYNRRDQRRK